MAPNLPDGISNSSRNPDGYFYCSFCQKSLYTVVGLRLHQVSEHNSESSTEREEHCKVQTRSVSQCKPEKDQTLQSKDDKTCPIEEATEAKLTSTKIKRKKTCKIEDYQFPESSQQIKRVNYKVKTRSVRQCKSEKDQTLQSKDDEICPIEEATEAKLTSTKTKRKKSCKIEDYQFQESSQQIKRVNYKVKTRSARQCKPEKDETTQSKDDEICPIEEATEAKLTSTKTKKCKIEVKQFPQQIKRVNHYVCRTCGKLYTCKRSLKYHVASVHDKLKFKCKQCEKYYTRQPSLKYHVESFHLKLKTKLCQICPSSFYHKRQLLVHKIMIHGEEGKHQCQHCYQTFPFNGILNSHVLSKHGRSKMGSLKLSLCQSCDKSFISKQSLQRHVSSTHEKLKLFQCQICKISVARKSSLNIHIKTIHQNLKAYLCQICPSSFFHKRQLSNHEIRIHGEK